MERSTQKMLRNAYFVGITLLILNALTVTRSYLGGLFDSELGGFKIIEIVAGLTAIGAVYAYNRQYI